MILRIGNLIEVCNFYLSDILKLIQKGVCFKEEFYKVVLIGFVFDFFFVLVFVWLINFLK